MEIFKREGDGRGEREREGKGLGVICGRSIFHFDAAASLFLGCDAGPPAWSLFAPY